MASGSTSPGGGGGSVPLERGLISTGSPSAGGSAPLRRGLLSCLHSLSCRGDQGNLLSDHALAEAMYKLIVGYYEEAFDRLPCKSMPDLLGLLSTGGFFLGVLDPASNIILNTLALLPRHAAEAAAAPPGTEKRSPPGSSDPWHEVSIRSYHGMLAFLVAYFGFLTKAQAARYLHRADANLPLAVMLVNHDFYMEGEEAMPHSESDRMRAALEWAATRTGHPSPTALARLMAIRLNPGDGLDLMERQFSADGRATALTVEDVQAVHRILHLMMTPIGVADVSHTRNGLVVHVRQNLKASRSETTTTAVSTTGDLRITSTAFCWDGTPISAVQFGLPEKLQDCLRRIAADGLQKQRSSRPRARGGDACDYLQSLEMYLHGIVHNLYVKALKLLPTPSGSLMRSILKAGHCYGSCDPLSNIILNSIWYDTCGSLLPDDDRRKFKEDNDVLDPLSLLRPVVHSLKGLTKMALFLDPQSSAASAMEKLCSTKCALVVDARERNPFHEAAMAAGHPLPLQLGELHRLLQLMPDQRSSLLALIAGSQASGCVVNVDAIIFEMSDMWHRSSEVETHVRVQAPQLSIEALRVVSTRRSDYEERRSWFRSKIEQVLQDYTDQHFWEPRYKLDIIVGVEESNQGRPPYFDPLYRVNFMATSDLKLQRTLFFAEFGSSEKPNSEFCVPITYPYVGRCYYGVSTARKIVYPHDAKYIPKDITQDGTGGVDRMLEMDIVYFSSELDVELAETLNMLPAEEESQSHYD